MIRKDLYDTLVEAQKIILDPETELEPMRALAIRLISVIEAEERLIESQQRQIVKAQEREELLNQIVELHKEIAKQIRIELT